MISVHNDTFGIEVHEFVFDFATQQRWAARAVIKTMLELKELM